MKLLLTLLINILILDSSSNEPLSGVTAVDTCSGKEYYSDIFGNIEVPDSCTLQISYISYRDTVITNPKLIKLIQE